MSDKRTKKARRSRSGDSSSGSASSTSMSSEEETDACDLKPIRDYLTNRRELAKQLFKSVKTEKIRMMLPQILKKMDMNDLEDWCASELSGMSKARILSILNGQPMIESSDTNDSDDSGPSLEIISDTEEWLTGDETVVKKESGSSPSRKSRQKRDKEKLKLKNKKSMKKSETEISKNKLKNKRNNTSVEKINIKTESEKGGNKGKGKEGEKEKEGENLLALLELELRARAIRALIRNEEDIIPSTSSSSTATSTLTTSTATSNLSKASQDVVKNMSNGKNIPELLENMSKLNENETQQVINVIKQNNLAEDEDVVLVVEPTTTIELLSSESEGEQNERVNKRLMNERVASKNNEDGENKNNESTEKSHVEDSGKIKEPGNEKTEEVVEPNKEETDQPSIKRLKKKPRTRVRKHSEVSDPEKQSENAEEEKPVEEKDAADKKESNQEKVVENLKENENIGIVEVTEEVGKNDKSEKENPKKVPLEEDKLMDFEEIIDLDSYSDDIEGIEGNSGTKEEKKEGGGNEVKKEKNTETWATRYYQTDDVQSVIKESKIQSEIRKRLRERQRISKLNNEKNQENAKNPTTSKTESHNKDGNESQPKGLVEEYLALKRKVASGNNQVVVRNSVVMESLATEQRLELVPKVDDLSMKITSEERSIVNEVSEQIPQPEETELEAGEIPD